MGHLGPHPHLRGGKFFRGTFVNELSGTFCRGQYLFLSQARLHFLGQSLPRSTSGEALLKRQKKSCLFLTPRPLPGLAQLDDP